MDINKVTPMSDAARALYNKLDSNHSEEFRNMWAVPKISQGYQPPVVLFESFLDNAMQQYVTDTETKIVSAISEQIGIDVDKQELIRALMYDRDQYEKGYWAGVTSVERPHGEWLESTQTRGHYYCSVCGGLHTDPETGEWRETFDYTYPFCPLCGADLRNNKTEEE